MFLGWQAVSWGRDYNSMRTQDKVLLVGLLEKETWATVLAVATAYKATVSTKDTSRRLSFMKFCHNMSAPLSNIFGTANGAAASHK
jgi:hypothetical protein